MKKRTSENALLMKPVSVLLVVITLLAVSAIARAQPANPDVKVFRKYMYASSYFVVQREAAVRRVLDAKPHLANATLDGRTVLAFALDYIDLAGSLGRRARKLAGWLVAKGANVNAKVRRGDTLLLKYARFAQVEAMAFLIKHGADVRAKDSDGRTALHHIAMLHEYDRKGRPKVFVKTFLRAAKILIAAKCDIDAKDKHGRTPLAHATFLGNLQMSKLLIAHKADVNNIDSWGYSVLASVIGRKTGRFANAREKALLPPVISLLRKRGARVVQPTYRR